MVHPCVGKSRETCFRLLLVLFIQGQACGWDLNLLTLEHNLPANNGGEYLGV